MSAASTFLARFQSKNVTSSASLPSAATLPKRGDADSSEDEQDGNFPSRSSDLVLRNAAISTPISEIAWECSSQCKFGKNCAFKQGFLPFMARLRKKFWGDRGDPPPSTKARSEKVVELATKFYRGGNYFSFGYTVSNEGDDIYVEICESAFFKALGAGKSTQWIRVMQSLVRGGNEVEKPERARFKSEKVRAFISLFLRSCDMPPTKTVQRFRILPFPNLKQFFEEYKCSFTPTFFEQLHEDDALRFDIDHSINCAYF